MIYVESWDKKVVFLSLSFSAIGAARWTAFIGSMQRCIYGNMGRIQLYGTHFNSKCLQWCFAYPFDNLIQELCMAIPFYCKATRASKASISVDFRQNM